MKRRVTIRWTDTAKQGLRDLPIKVRRGLFEKADKLAESGSPEKHSKALTGPLANYYRIVYSRYRAIFSLEEEEIANGDVLVHVTMLFVAVGIRKAHDKNDIYEVAKKLVRLVLDDGDDLTMTDGKGNQVP